MNYFGRSSPPSAWTSRCADVFTPTSESMLTASEFPRSSGRGFFFNALAITGSVAASSTITSRICFISQRGPGITNNSTRPKSEHNWSIQRPNEKVTGRGGCTDSRSSPSEAGRNCKVNGSLRIVSIGMAKGPSPDYGEDHSGRWSASGKPGQDMREARGVFASHAYSCSRNPRRKNLAPALMGRRSVTRGENRGAQVSASLDNRNQCNRAAVRSGLQSRNWIGDESRLCRAAEPTVRQTLRLSN